MTTSTPPEPDDEPVFAAPWQAQAFAMTVRLHEQGCFTWTEWAECLSAEITAAQARGDPDRGDTYYDHWLAALEKMVAAKGLIPPADLAARRDAWDAAARATPHGEPIVLRKSESE
jgi:nitrile hydratase accessory protein